MKDFYDIWLMMRRFDFNGLRLAEAVKRTFKHRKTSLPIRKPVFAEEIYYEKSDRQTLWKSFLIKEDIKHAPEKLCTTAREIENFLINPLKAVNKGEKFNKKWKTPGLWS